VISELCEGIYKQDVVILGYCLVKQYIVKPPAFSRQSTYHKYSVDIQHQDKCFTVELSLSSGRGLTVETNMTLPHSVDFVLWVFQWNFLWKLAKLLHMQAVPGEPKYLVTSGNAIFDSVIIAKVSSLNGTQNILSVAFQEEILNIINLHRKSNIKLRIEGDRLYIAKRWYQIESLSPIDPLNPEGLVALCHSVERIYEEVTRHI